MKNIAPRLYLTSVMAMLIFCHTASAQRGIRFNYFDYCNNVKDDLLKQGYLGLGYEQNVGKYVALSLEVNNSFGLLNEMIRDGETFGSNPSYEAGSSYGNYVWFFPAFEVGYQSKYFFRGNDETSLYLSSGIAFKSVKYKLEVFDAYDSNGGTPVIEDGKYSQSFTIIPLSLRFGFRNDLEGYFWDCFAGVNYNIGSDQKFKDAEIEPYIKVPDMNTFSIVIGFNCGIGW